MSVLQARGAESLDPLSVGDLDVPAFLLERVVDQPGAGHRLDDRADRLSVDLVDPPSQGLKRVDLRRDDELVELLSLL